MSATDKHAAPLLPAPEDGGAAHARLVAGLRDPSRHAGLAGPVELLETHCSSVLLAGDVALKLKKPVNLGFLDFSSLQARRFYCYEELRLNRRTAPQLYLDVVSIGGSADYPLIGAEPTIDYAVRMRRFSQDELLDRVARRGALTLRHVDALAADVAQFHAAAAVDPAQSFGSAAQIREAMRANCVELEAVAKSPRERALLRGLADWLAAECAELAPQFDARRCAGLVRECHGDLHLGNIALIEDRPTPFDCIEFNAEFRNIDVINDSAFLMMDLIYHGLAPLAFRFINAYLERSGDYAAMAVLRFYLVQRALIRAKVARIRSLQAGIAAEQRGSAERSFRMHLLLARRLARRGRAALIVMHGLSGSGKSSFAQVLLEALGAVRLRSDVERKRLFGLDAVARTGAAPDGGIYSVSAGVRTYARLAETARSVLAAGYPVVVDAACLQRAPRELLCRVAREQGLPFALVSCEAALPVLRERVAQREQQGTDASDAGGEVLEQQYRSQQPLAADEMPHVIRVATAVDGAGADGVAARLARRLGLAISRKKHRPEPVKK